MSSTSESSVGDQQIIVNQPITIKLSDVEMPKFDDSYNK